MRTPHLLAFAIALTACGCEETFYVAFVPSRPPDCEGEVDDLQRSRGVLDIVFAHNYFAELLIHNTRGSSSEDDIMVSGANVSLWVGGIANGTEWGFYQPVSGFVEGERSAVLEVVVVPEAYLDSYGVNDFDPCGSTFGVPPLVTAGIELLGTTTAGTEVETPRFFFSVDLCCGCLVECPVESTDEEGNLCMSTEPPDEEPYRIGQDDPFDCRLCEDPWQCASEFCM